MYRFFSRFRNIAVAILLTALTIILPLGTSAAVPEGEVLINTWGFVLSEDYSLVSGNPTANGSFANGNVGAYAEGSCVPVLIDVTNDSDTIGDIEFRFIFDYFSNGPDPVVGIDHLETIFSGLPDPMNDADNLNDFTYPGSDFTASSMFTSASGTPINAIVSGPYSGNDNGVDPIQSDDADRHYNILLEDVPAGGTVHVLACARLGQDAGQFPGSSMHASTSNGNGNGPGQVPIPSNELLELPTLIVEKSIMGGSATPSNWTFNVSPAINGTTNFVMASGSSTFTFPNVPPGTYTITEPTGPADYVFTDGTGDCTFGNNDASVTLASDTVAQTETCTLVNTFVPLIPTTGTITVNKVVTTDSGGPALDPNSVALFINGAPVTNGVANTQIVGSYFVSETAVPGYTGTFSGDCDANGNITLGANQNLVCTITNDDDIPNGSAATGTIIVIKEFEGPTCTPSSCQSYNPINFSITVHSSSTPSTTVVGNIVGIPVVVNLGNYIVSEEPIGVGAGGIFTTYSSDCTGTIADGETKTCTVTNHFISTAQPIGQLYVIKSVINDDGGTSVPGDFMLTLDSEGLDTDFPGSALTSFLIPLGDFSVTEAPTPGYLASFSPECSGTMGEPIDFGDGDIQPQVFGCIVTNDDIEFSVTSTPATSTVTTIVEIINDDGGSAVASDVTVTLVEDSATSTFPGNASGTTVTFAPSAFSVSGTIPTGYTLSLSADCTGKLEANESVTCTMTYNDPEPVDPCDDEDGCESDPCDFEEGGVDPCPDLQGTLIVQMVVINDNGGGRPPSDFFPIVSGVNPSLTTFPGNTSGTVVMLDPGAYNVSQEIPANYLLTIGANCSGTIAGGQTIVCVITNDDLTTPGGGGGNVPGGGGGGGGGGGTPIPGTPSGGTPVPETPPGRVLGDTDEDLDSSDPADPVIPTAPSVPVAPVELPRTGMPVGLAMSALLPLLALLRRRE
ncbi:MAG: hypothetical protein WC787_00850 [Patescibacteria group bacterium]|jgi:hypothetical protein